MKIFIPSAGVGSRISAYTRYRNKALLTLGNTPAITKIINKFDKDIPIVVAVGYQKQILKEYLAYAHNDRNIVLEYSSYHMGIIWNACNKRIHKKSYSIGITNE